MNLATANKDGIFTFKTEEAGQETVFVRSYAVVANIEDGHCSQHTLHMAGCADCTMAALFHATVNDEFEKLAKAASVQQLVIDPANLSPRSQLIKQQMERLLAVFFFEYKHKASAAAQKEAKRFVKTDTDEELIAMAAYMAIEWAKIVDNMYFELLGAYQTGIATAMTQLGMVSEEMEAELNKLAAEYAEKRSAEIVGMKLVDGNLVENTAAKMAISATTRDDLQDIVENAIKTSATQAELDAMILNAYTFSDIRSRLIAKNETAVAEVRGHLAGWQLSGRVKKVNVVVSARHSVYDSCDELVAGNPYAIESAPLIPDHPNCECSLIGIEEAA